MPKRGTEGSNPLIWRPTAVNSIYFISFPVYSPCDTAVKRYIFNTAAAAVHPKKPQILKFPKRINRMRFSISAGKKEAKEKY